MKDISRRSGFTLIEILVVLLILAIAGTFMIVGYNQLLARQAASEIDEFHAWLEAAADIAVLQSTVLGVARDDSQLKLMAYMRGEWFLLADQVFLDIGEEVQIIWPEQALDPEVLQTINDNHPQPYLVLTPAGEIFPEGQIELDNNGRRAFIQWPDSQGFTLAWQGS